jgi:hypothetical protein
VVPFLKNGFVYFVACTLPFAAVYADLDSSINMPPMERPRALPPALYGHAGDPAVLISAAYTYWTAREDNLLMSYSNFNSLSGSSVQGNSSYPVWNTFSGFKVALGTILPHDAWELCAEFTYFVADRPFTNHNVITGGTTSVWSTDFPITSISSQWNNWMYRGDLDLRYTFFVGNYLSLTTLGGLASVFGDQTLNITQSPFETTPAGTITATQWAWGIGPHLAFESDFAFYGTSHNQFSFFFQGGGAILLSQYQTTQLWTSTSTSSTYFSNGVTLYADNPLLETMFGLRWHTFIDGRDAASFLVELGWEEQVILGYNYLSSTINANSPGNYWMYGLTLRAQIGF